MNHQSKEAIAVSENQATNNNFTVPPNQDFDTLAFQGSMQQVLQENVGNYVIVEFLIGTGSLISRQGVLYNVSTQFLVLFDEFESRYVVCDIFSVKFVTFLLPGYRPGQVPGSSDIPRMMTTEESLDVLPTSAKPIGVTPARAAYDHTMRKGR